MYSSENRRWVRYVCGTSKALNRHVHDNRPNRQPVRFILALLRRCLDLQSFGLRDRCLTLETVKKISQLHVVSQQQSIRSGLVTISIYMAIKNLSSKFKPSYENLDWSTVGSQSAVENWMVVKTDGARETLRTKD